MTRISLSSLRLTRRTVFLGALIVAPLLTATVLATTIPDTLLVQGATTLDKDVRINGGLQVEKYFAVQGVEMLLGRNDGRMQGTKTNNRALVHGQNDELYVNFDGDFEGGTTIQSDTTVAGNLSVNGMITQLGGFNSLNVDQWPYVTFRRDLANGWDDGIIKHDPSHGSFGKAGFGVHMDPSKEFGFYSGNWDTLASVDGGTGNSYFKGNMGIGTATPTKKLEVAGSMKVANDITINGNIVSDNNAMSIKFLGQAQGGGMCIGACD